MKIHEYQAKAILKQYGVPVPRGEETASPSEVADIAKRLGTSVVVVKAQIHAGGRGKGGGVKIAKSPAEAESIAKNMLGMTLVTHQTGPERARRGPPANERGPEMEGGAVPHHRPDPPSRKPRHHGQPRRGHGHQ